MSSTPERVNVPEDVIGPPANENPVVPPETSTEVTDPEPPPEELLPGEFRVRLGRSSMAILKRRNRCSRYSYETPVVTN